MKLGATALIIYLAATSLMTVAICAALAGAPYWWKAMRLHLLSDPDAIAALLGNAFAGYGGLWLTAGLPLVQIAALGIVLAMQQPFLPGIAGRVLVALTIPSRLFLIISAICRFLLQLIGIFTGTVWWPGFALDATILMAVTALSGMLVEQVVGYDQARANRARIAWGRVWGRRL